MEHNIKNNKLWELVKFDEHLTSKIMSHAERTFIK